MFSDVIANKKNGVLNEFFNQLNIVSNQISSVNQSMFLKFENVIDEQMQIINLNFAVLDYKNTDFSEIILSLCYKNLISLLSALELIKKGFLGSSKIIFRNVYESLMIGKYLGITHDKKLYDKWKKGEYISLNQHIFKKFFNSPSKESLEFWDFLNKYTHSTIYAQDFMLEFDKGEIDNCNTIITTLIAMNNHLLNIFVSNYYSYYLGYYFNPSYSSIKKNLSNNISILIKMIDPRCKVVIKEYKAKWDIV